jgi:hypothetical protein
MVNLIFMKINKISIMIITELLLSLLVLPIVCSVEPVNQNIISKQELNSEDISLLHAEHYLYLDAIKNVSLFNIRYSFPPEYKGQYPIFLEIINDSTANIIDYKIENDKNEPNKFVNFTIGAMVENDQVLIHIKYWVLIKNYNYSDFPKNIQIPKQNDLPIETKKWLSATEVVQKEKILIKLRAKQIQLFTNNLVKLSDRIGKFCKWHRYIFFLIQYNLGSYKSQDALTTLFRNGECPGRSHLGSALFRANGIPSRIILSCPVYYNFWYEMHYMIEYYTNEDFDWILSDVHSGKSPIEQKNHIIHRICYLEDENNTQTDFLNKKMKGIENWFWIDNEFIKPYYKDLIEGSKSRGFSDNEMFVNSSDAKSTIELTKLLFSKFEYYLAISLTGENLDYFKNATGFQKKAINLFKNSSDPYGYLIFLNLACEEYNKIQI